MLAIDGKRRQLDGEKAETALVRDHDAERFPGDFDHGWLVDLSPVNTAFLHGWMLHLRVKSAEWQT